MLRDDARQMMNDERQLIATGHLSDSGDQIKINNDEGRLLYNPLEQ